MSNVTCRLQGPGPVLCVDDYLTAKSDRYREKHEYLLRTCIAYPAG